MPINYQALYDLQTTGDPRAIVAAKNMTPDEQQEWFDFQKAQHGQKGQDPTSNRKDSDMFSVGKVGVAPEVLLGGLGLRDTLLKYAPSMGSVGTTVKGAAGGAVGYEVTSQLLKGLGLPPALANILSMVGAGVGGHMGAGMGGGKMPIPGAAAAATEAEIAASKAAKGGVETVPPMSGEEYLNATGKARNAFKVPTTNDAEMAEQVKRGVQNDFKAPVSFKDPKTAAGAPRVIDPEAQSMRDQTGSSKLGNAANRPQLPTEEQGAKELEELLDRLHGQDRASKGNGGAKSTPYGGGLSSIKPEGLPKNLSVTRTAEDVANTTRGGVHVSGATFDGFNPTEDQMAERLDRLLKQMDQRKPTSKLKTRKK